MRVKTEKKERRNKKKRREKETIERNLE